MNVLITLPNDLIQAIQDGRKIYEMRKNCPKRINVGEEGFYVVEKGTESVKLWCQIDCVESLEMTEEIAEKIQDDVCRPVDFILSYAPVGTKVYLWGIGKVVQLNNLRRSMFNSKTNPQSFVYVLC